jgi:competence protein ComEC
VAQTKQGCGCAVAVLVVVMGALGVVGVKFALPWWKQKPPPPSGKELQVHVLNVGQGDSILIIVPEGKTVLIDAGDETKGKVVVDALKRYNVQQIDLFIATHAHPDHIGGAPEVFKAVKVATVWHNDSPPPEYESDTGAANNNANAAGKSNAGGKGNAQNKRAQDQKATPKPAPKKGGKNILLPTVKTYTDLRSAVETSGAEWKAVGAGERYDLGGGALLNVLAPTQPFFTREQIRSGGGNEPNANSIVVRLDYGDFSMLLPGDAEAQTEDRMESKEANLAAKILKVAHHGSKYATSENFLRRVKPEAAIISDGDFNHYGHPSPLVLERLKAAGVTKLYRTDMQGEITITTTGKLKDGKLYDIKAAKETKGDLWAGREPQKDDSTRSGFISYGEFGPPPRQKKK